MFAVSDSALERVWREDCPLLDVTVHALGIEAALLDHFALEAVKKRSRS